MHGERERGTMLHVGIVHGVDGIRFVAAADTRTALMKELAVYVERQSALLLYPDEAGTVQQLLASGETDKAVGLYFERVGARWDREWLTRDVVPVARGRSGRGDVIPLFDSEGPDSGAAVHIASDSTNA